jgi:hypothetical protein
MNENIIDLSKYVTTEAHKRYGLSIDAEFFEFPFVAAVDAARRQALAKCETVIAARVSLQYRGGYTWSPEAKSTACILREARKVIEEVRLSLQLLPLWAWA